jgi:hypothetical protein
MANIFLSYRRTDSPQACRVYDWLVQRFGNDAVFMDVAAIPFAASFQDFIRQQISACKVLIALIGPEWQSRIRKEDDVVRIEIEAAIASRIPVLPVLIGTTPMPRPDELPPSISSITLQNAAVVGVSRDFHAHMQSLLVKIEAILGRMATQSVVTSNSEIVHWACTGIMTFLRERSAVPPMHFLMWQVVNSNYFSSPADSSVTLFLHRLSRLSESLELHFILTFWINAADSEQMTAGWVMRELERTPIIPEEAIARFIQEPLAVSVKVRTSDEDARQIWKMITDQPLRLSLAYVATISPKLPTESGNHLESPTERQPSS